MLKQIVVSICVIAIFSSIVLTVPTNRGMKEILRIACGLLMIVVILSPLQKHKNNKIYFPKFDTDIIDDNSNDLFFKSIEDSILKNIRNRAELLGIDCSISIKLGEDFSIEEVIIETDDSYAEFKEELIKDYGVKNVRTKNKNRE